jgi:hypothetical protein
MRLHRIDIGAVEQGLVGIGIVAAHPIDEVVLPHHPRLGRLLLDLRRLGQAVEAMPPRRRRARLVLHPGQIGRRSGHVLTRAAAGAQQAIVSSYHVMADSRSGNACGGAMAKNPLTVGDCEPVSPAPCASSEGPAALLRPPLRGRPWGARLEDSRRDERPAPTREDAHRPSPPTGGGGGRHRSAGAVILRNAGRRAERPSRPLSRPLPAPAAPAGLPAGSGPRGP